MKLVIFGAGGRIGMRILTEALARGHAVTAAVRDAARLGVTHEALSVVDVDLRVADGLARVAAGHDAAVNAVGPGRDGDTGVIVAAARALTVALPAAGVRRLIVVGGAGTLQIRPGVERLDTPEYPEIYRASGYAHREALQIYHDSDLDWSFLSPPVIIAPGTRSGHYRLGRDQVLFDEQGNSRISMEDYAVALIDELERPRHVRARFTVAGPFTVSG